MFIVPIRPYPTSQVPSASDDRLRDQSAEGLADIPKPRLLYVKRRVVRTCVLMGHNRYTGTTSDHRVDWIAGELERQKPHFAIELIAWTVSVMEFHMLLRTRPDWVSGWDDEQVADRWLRLCPLRKFRDGSAREPSERELTAIMRDRERLAEIRRRLADSSWWLRLMCQRIAQWANAEEGETGGFWEPARPPRELDSLSSLKVCEQHFDINVMLRALRETPGVHIPPRRRSRR